MMMRLNQSMTLWTNQYQTRSSASTGARIHPDRISLVSPKGGFVTPVYETARYIDERYGYRTESYYRERLFGRSADSSRWRYDLNKRIIGRPDWKSKYAPFPRFPKQKYRAPPYDKYIQEDSIIRSSKFLSRFQQSGNRTRKGQHSGKANQFNRWRRSDRKSCKVFRDSILCKQCGCHSRVHQLYNPVQTNKSKFHRSTYRRW